MMKDSRRRETTEEGTVFALVLLALVPLLLLVSILIFLGRQSTVESRLKSFADVVAHAGAAVLCFDESCWDDSLDVAVAAANKQDLGVDPLSTMDRLAGVANPTWELNSGEYRISIERGLWAAATQEFIGLEDWTSARPAALGVRVANAVRVGVQRSNINMPAFFMQLPGATIAAESIAVTALVPETQVAPFAIPLCAVLDENADFDPRSLCQADRFFTRIDRYCPPANPNCGIVPDFDNQPYLENAYIDGGNEEQEYNRSTGLPYKWYYNTGRFWNAPRFEQVADHFGVVGLPGVTVVDEVQVRNVIGSDAGTVTAQIGQIFGVLEDGLRAPATAFSASPSAVALQNRLNNPTAGGGIFLRATHLGRVVTHNYDGLLDPAALAPGGAINAVEPQEVIDPVTSTIIIRPSSGICNSRLSGLRDWVRSNGVGTYTSAQLDELRDTIIPQIDRNRVWDAAIPIIADFGAGGQPCSGMPDSSGVPATEDPPFLTGVGHEWRIIAFLNALIYDFDVGAAVNPQPIIGVDVADNASLDASVAGGYHYGFSLDGVNAEPCNLVRARLECGLMLRKPIGQHGVLPSLRRKAILVQ